MNIINVSRLFPACLLTFMLSLYSHSAFAASKEEIDIRVDGALERFKEEVMGGVKFLEKAEAVKLSINGNDMIADRREFSTGSFGW